ncbi:DUF1349 domain-containing protein [Streptomyces sp. NPDC059101]|uniref:DUF1349 domain-containing protein n=1 Tax=unclassified Streptomyces TaxID=2593676 RepID=UPI0021534BCC|nr:DUF1349 domain-containing protein [Streptomyces sp. CB02959]
MTAPSRPVDPTGTRAIGFDDPGWRFDGPGTAPVRHAAELRVRAPRGADLFRMPGAYEASGIPRLSRRVTGDHTLWTRVTVDGREFGDAGGIVVHDGAGWFKVCVERTRAGGWAVVTVVSHPVSDEAAGPVLAGPDAELLVTREGRRYAVFHREHDGGDWRFVRTFFGADEADVRVGLFAQAPFSDACTASFAPLRLAPTALADRR